MNLFHKARIPLGLLIVLSLAAPVSADIIRVASWNMEHLRDTNGEGKRPRTENDYHLLREHAQGLAADVVAVQEVENTAALGRVFDPAQYRLLVSNRPHAQRTGFAVHQSLRVKRHPDLQGLNTSGGLRHGVDIEIETGGRKIRLLSVHLKSFCFKGSVVTPVKKDCKKLARQIPVLEQWIDDRAREGIPFLVLGDFNRRFDVPGDDFWPEIDDGEPAQLKLTRANAGMNAQCNPKYQWFIDHMVYDRLVSPWVVPDSFEEHLYTGDLLSDHCPISMKLDLNR